MMQMMRYFVSAAAAAADDAVDVLVSIAFESVEATVLLPSALEASFPEPAPAEVGVLAETLAPPSSCRYRPTIPVQPSNVIENWQRRP